MDILESIKSNFKDRIESPLSGAFCVSWVLWNYKFFVVIFSNMEPGAKFHYIEQSLWNPWYIALIFFFFGPLATALFYIFIYPVPARWALKFSLESKRDIQEIRLAAEGKRPISEEEAMELRVKYIHKADDLENQLKNQIEIARAATAREREIKDSWATTLAELERVKEDFKYPPDSAMLVRTLERQISSLNTDLSNEKNMNLDLRRQIGKLDEQILRYRMALDEKPSDS